MSRATGERSDPRALVTRQATSSARRSAISSVWAIASNLRTRDDWFLTSASVSQSWKLSLDGRQYRVGCYVSLFLDGSRGPGVVFNVSVVAVRAGHSLSDEFLSTPWFHGLQERLGPEYECDAIRSGRVSLGRVLRGTTKPRRILDELRHVSSAIEKTHFVRRRRKLAPAEAPKPLQQRGQDVWTILDQLRGTDWEPSSIHQSLQHQVQHDGCRWHVAVKFLAAVDSAVNKPGFAGMVDTWSRVGERKKRRNPISQASRALLEKGYRRLATTHYQRWHPGLSRRAAAEEVELLEHVMASMLNRAQA